MSPEMEALRSHQGVVASVIAAAIGFTLFCLVGIAVLLGWIGPGVRPLTTKAPAAAHAPANELALSPGETVVATTGPPAPASPPPPAPAPATPVPAPATPVTPAPATKPAAPPPVQRKPVNTMAPRARPEFARAPASAPIVVPATKPAPAPTSAPHPSDPGDPWPQPPCGNCGVVHSITTFPDLWEVRVRFDDGGRRTIRYHRQPRWRVGDRIRYEGGQLQRE